MFEGKDGLDQTTMGITAVALVVLFLGAGYSALTRPAPAPSDGTERTAAAPAPMAEAEDAAPMAVAESEETTAEELTTEVADAEDTATEEVAAEVADAEETATEEVAAEVADAEETATEEVAAEVADAEETATEEVAAEVADAEDTATEEGTTEVADAEDTATEEGTAEVADAEETATEEGTTEVAAAEETATEVAEAAATTDSGWSDAQLALLDGDAAAGQRVWNQCRACHVADKEQNRVGPHLVNVIGRDVASIDGFRYSAALQGLQGQQWTPEEMDAWLTNPRDYAQGTSMAYRGLQDEEDRRNVLAYLWSLQN